MVDNPYLRLGYGVNAYYSTIMHLVKMFTVITLFLLPVFYVYAKAETKFLKTLP